MSPHDYTVEEAMKHEADLAYLRDALDKPAPRVGTPIERTFDWICRTAEADYFDGDDMQDAIRQAIAEPNVGFIDTLAELIFDYYTDAAVASARRGDYALTLPSERRAS